MRSLASYCLLVAALLAAAGAQSRHRVQGPFPARAGEICVVCYRVLQDTGLAYVIDGQRFAVDSHESGEFLEDPDAYIQPFEERQAAERRMAVMKSGAAAALAAGGLLAVWMWRRWRRRPARLLS
jgi:hypothetical protein